MSNENRSRSLFMAVLMLLIVAVPAIGVQAQVWNWTPEKVDNSGQFSSIAVDKDGSLHVSYSTGDGIKYAYRTSDSSKWYTMLLDKPEGYTSLALDQEQHPHICYTNNQLKYASWDGKAFQIQVIAPFSGQINFTCSVAVAKDGTAHVSWYQYMSADRSNYLHLKYAVLKDGLWQAKTIDFRPETGKWNSMLLDKDGNPHLSYSAYMDGDLKYAHYDGKHWVLATPDSRALSRSPRYRGMGNSIAMDKNGVINISYFEDLTLKYARQKGDSWSTMTIDNLSSVLGASGWTNSRSTVLVDGRGFPHILYGDVGSLKHAYWNGSSWKIQFIAYGGSGQYAYTSAAIDAADNIYVSYLDPTEGSLNVAIGRKADQPAPSSNVAGTAEKSTEAADPGKPVAEAKTPEAAKTKNPNQ